MKIRVGSIDEGTPFTEVEKGSLYQVGPYIYYVGSDDEVSSFSLQSGEWITLPFYGDDYACADHAGDLVDDKIYITGAEIGTNEDVDEETYVYELDLVLGTIDIVQTFGVTVGPTDIAAMSALYANWRREIVYFGGYIEYYGDLFEYGSALEFQNKTYCFDVDSKSWQLLQMRGQVPTPRRDHGALLKGYDMYIYGGHNENVGYLSDIWIAHLAPTKRPFWTKPVVEGRVPPGRAFATFNSLDGYFVVCGGESNHQNLHTSIELYCPQTRRWWAGKSAEERSQSHENSIEVIGNHSKPEGFPLGIAVQGGVLILADSHLDKITIEHAT